LVGL